MQSKKTCSIHCNLHLNWGGGGGGGQASQKLLAELIITLHMSNQQHKSESNGPINVGSYANSV